MPIHRYILFDPASGAHDCAAEATTRVDLVQDAIVKYDSTYVDTITVTYSPDSVGRYSTLDFVLIFLRTNPSYTITPITATVIDSDNGSSASMTTTTSTYTVTFSAPSTGGTKLFEFGDSSGPPSKVKVKIKHQPTTYSC